VRLIALHRYTTAFNLAQGAQKLVVFVRYIGSQSQLLIRLFQKLFRPSRVAAQAVTIVLLRDIHFFPRSNDKLLGRSQITMLVSDVHEWLLRKYHSATHERQTKRDTDQQASLGHDSFLPLVSLKAKRFAANFWQQIRKMRRQF
jgi:hypothetical protein